MLLLLKPEPQTGLTLSVLNTSSHVMYHVTRQTWWPYLLSYHPCLCDMKLYATILEVFVCNLGRCCMKGYELHVRGPSRGSIGHWPNFRWTRRG